MGRSTEALEKNNVTCEEVNWSNHTSQIVDSGRVLFLEMSSLGTWSLHIIVIIMYNVVSLSMAPHTQCLVVNRGGLVIG